MAHPHPAPEGPCPNCGQPLTAQDRFCARCGQENHDLKVPIGHLLYETVEGIWHFDNKFFKTLGTALARPGQIVFDYLEGRRARYVPPIRLYVFVSIIFFFLVSKATQRESKSNDGALKFNYSGTQGMGFRWGSGTSEPDTNAPQPAGAPIRDTVKISGRARSVALAGLEGNWDTGYHSLTGAFLSAIEDSLVRALDTAAVPDWRRHVAEATNDLGKDLRSREDTLLVDGTGTLKLARYQDRFMGVPSDSASMMSYARLTTKGQIDSLFRHYGRQVGFMDRLIFRRTVHFHELLATGQGESMIKALWLPVFVKYSSVAMFLLMPLAGFILLMFFYRQRRYYYEHLIFSIYTHAVAFLLFSIAMLLDWAANGTAIDRTVDLATDLMVAMVLVYFVLSLKRVYRQGWARTLVKSLGLMMLYSVALVFLTAGIFLVSLATF